MKLKRIGAVVMSAVFCVVVYSGCSKQNPETVPAAGIPKNDDEVSLSLNVTLKSPQPGSLTPDQAIVVDALTHGKALSHKELTKMFVRMHDVAWKSRNGDVDSPSVMDDIRTLATGAEALDPITELKISYEKKLEARHGRLMVYNKQSSNLHQIFEQASMQCYSGTALHLAVARESRSGRQYADLHPVVVMESGHILPGYIIDTQSQFHLYVVESTRRGGAAKYLGRTDRMDATPRRIIDANLFVAIEIIKSQITNTKDVLNQALKITADKYGIPLARQESLIPRATEIAIDAVIEPKVSQLEINSTFLAFGEDTTPEGVIERTEAGNSFPAGASPQDLRRAVVVVESGGTLTRNSAEATPKIDRNGDFECSPEGFTLFWSDPRRLGEWRILYMVEEVIYSQPSLRFCCAIDRKFFEYSRVANTNDQVWKDPHGSVASVRDIQEGVRHQGCFPTNYRRESY